jgi:hypothetical protein
MADVEPHRPLRVLPVDATCPALSPAGRTGSANPVRVTGLGAFAHVGAIDDRHTVTGDASDTVVCARLVNQQAGSRLRGARKEVVLGTGDLSLAVGHDLAGAQDAHPLDVDLCLSDHLGLLDHGHEAVTRSRGTSLCAAGRGPLTVWVAVGPGWTAGADALGPEER